MKQIQLIFLVAIWFIISCHADKKKARIDVTVLTPFPVVLDSIGVDKFLHFFDDSNPTWSTTSNYNFYFIGKAKDTLYLYPYFDFYPSPPPPLTIEKGAIRESITFSRFDNPYKSYYLEWDDESSYRNWNQSKIEIRVDTATRLANTYPVMLTNLDTNTIFIGYGRHIPIIMEATDSLGNWRPIQQSYVYGCGVGVGRFILPPNNCVITLAPIYGGNYKTTLRLRLGNNYSRPFIGFINYRQFESIVDEHGDYRKEYLHEMVANKTTSR